MRARETVLSLSSDCFLEEGLEPFQAFFEISIQLLHISEPRRHTISICPRMVGVNATTKPALACASLHCARARQPRRAPPLR